MTVHTRLTLAEELVLIALDDERGSLISLPQFSLEFGLAAALVMELTLLGRVDTDVEKLFVISADKTGNALLDDALAQIIAEPQDQPTGVWLRRLSQPGPVAGLVDRGILHPVEKRLLWVFKTRVYPPTSGLEEAEVKSRLMTLLNNDDIPETHDALLVGLLRATGIFERLLSASEFARLSPRINQIANLEEISRELTHTISELQAVMASAFMFG